MRKFAIVAVNAKTGIPGLMDYADTRKEAMEIQDKATRAGWLLATICESPGELHEFGKAVTHDPS